MSDTRLQTKYNYNLHKISNCICLILKFKYNIVNMTPQHFCLLLKCKTYKNLKFYKNGMEIKDIKLICFLIYRYSNSIHDQNVHRKTPEYPSWVPKVLQWLRVVSNCTKLTLVAKLPCITIKLHIVCWLQKKPQVIRLV